MQNRTVVQAQELVIAPPRSHANAARRILVVEDDAAIRESSTEVLACSGYEVHAAEHGEAGWQALHASSYDLLITDNNTPKLSGIELNRNPWLHLAATLEKPFTIDELLETVREGLREADRARTRFPAPAEIVSKTELASRL